MQHAIGVALMVAQGGGKHSAAKPLKGFKGAGVLELIKARLEAAEQDYRKQKAEE